MHIEQPWNDTDHMYKYNKCVSLRENISCRGYVKEQYLYILSLLSDEPVIPM